MARTMTVRPVASRVQSETVDGRESHYRYDLLQLTSSSGRSYYFVVIARLWESGQEELQTSPVIGQSLGPALATFHKLATAAGGVSPLHLTDVVRDLILNGTPPLAADQPTAAESAN